MMAELRCVCPSWELENGVMRWYCQAHGREAALQQEVERLREENKELESLFDLQYKRMREATERWRAAHPGNDLVSPDLGNLLTWLLHSLDEADLAVDLAEPVQAVLQAQNADLVASLVAMREALKRTLVWTGGPGYRIKAYDGGGSGIQWYCPLCQATSRLRPDMKHTRDCPHSVLTGPTTTAAYETARKNAEVVERVRSEVARLEAGAITRSDHAVLAFLRSLLGEES